MGPLLPLPQVLSAGYSPVTNHVLTKAGLLLQKLLNDKIAVIGGVAVAAWGTPRSTGDIDVIARAPLAELRDALKQAGVPCDIKLGDPEDALPWVIHGALSPVGIKEPVKFQIIPAPRRVRLQGDVVTLPNGLRIIGFEDLITLKCAAGGPQDIVDIARLSVARPETQARVREITKKFELDSRVFRYISEFGERDS